MYLHIPSYFEKQNLQQDNTNKLATKNKIKREYENKI